MKKLFPFVLSAMMIAACGSQSSQAETVTTSYSTAISESVAEEESADLSESWIESVTWGLLKQTDEMTGVNYYYSQHDHYYKDPPGQILNSIYYENNMVFLPFTVELRQKDSDSAVFVSLEWIGDDWIFFNKFMIKTGNEETFTVDIPDYDKTTDVWSGGTVVERYSFAASDALLDYFQNVIDNGSGIIRLSGDKYYQIDLDPETIKAMNEIVSAYRKLNQ